MLPHARHSEQLVDPALAVRGLEQLADEFDSHLGLKSVENPPRVVQRGRARASRIAPCCRRTLMASRPFDTCGPGAGRGAVPVAHSVEVSHPRYRMHDSSAVEPPSGLSFGFAPS